MSKRYFINNLDSYLGRALFNELYKPNEEDPEAEPDNVIIASYTDPDRTDKPKGVTKLLKRSKPKLFAKYVVESEVIIYDLHFGDIKEIEFALKGFKQRDPPEGPTTLIFVSSIMVWDGTEKKIKVKKPEEPGEEDPNAIKETDREHEVDSPEKEKKDPEAKEGETSLIEGEVDPNKEENKEPGAESKEGVSQLGISIEKAPELPPEYEPFKEEDFVNRTPKEKYRFIKELEDLVLSFKWGPVKTYVVCPGIFYGQGELVFKNYFKTAWLQSPPKLPYLGNGENKIPTIHIKDLAKFIIKLADNPPDNKYHFAVDNSKDKRQKALVQSISTQLGTGEVESVEVIENTIIDPQWEDIMRLDLEVVSSTMLVNEEAPPDFEWHCEKGINENMGKLVNEYCLAESLKPVKIMLRGQPNSRKSEFAQFLANHYNVPVIRIKETIERGLNLADDLGRDLREERGKLDEYFAEAKELSLDETGKVLSRLMKWRLSQNDCRNRGYVLDDFPQYQNEMNNIFVKKLAKTLKRKKPKTKKKPEKKGKKKVQSEEEGLAVGEGEEGANPEEGGKEEEEKKEEGEEAPQEEEPQEEEEKPEGEGEEEPAEEIQEEEEEEGALPKLENYFPDSVIYFKRKANVPVQDKAKLKKFDEYEKATKINDFFDERNIEIYIHDLSNKSDDQDALESLRIFIERNGRPNNYLKTPKELSKELMDIYEKRHSENVQRHTKEKIKTTEELQAIDLERHRIADEELQFIKKFEIPTEKEKSMPFRKYLMGNVIPILGDGLVEITQILPDDPVDYLAEYLYKRSFEIGNNKA